MGKLRFKKILKGLGNMTHELCINEYPIFRYLDPWTCLTSARALHMSYIDLGLICKFVMIFLEKNRAGRKDSKSERISDENFNGGDHDLWTFPGITRDQNS